VAARSTIPHLVVAALAALVPLAVIATVGTEKVYLDGWVHVLCVSFGAALAAVAALALVVAGARAQDGRAVVIGVSFSIMSALLLVHGIATPGVWFEMNGVVGLTGGLTVPVGGAILALSAHPAVARPGAVRPLLRMLGVGVTATLVLGLLGLVAPGLVPAIPDPRSVEAYALLALGLAVYGLLGLRALRTFRLTRRKSDLAVVVGISWLAVALVPALVQDFWNIGWWLGHGVELAGIVLVALPVAVDLRRGSAQSRPLVGDISAVQLVLDEEAFLGSHVRSLLVSLAAKDVSTEEHTRRVALRGVEVGEELGLPAESLRDLALGGLLHDIGKLAVPTAILAKPDRLTDDEFAAITQHPASGVEILRDLGGFASAVLALVRHHHERLDGSGYPDGVDASTLGLPERILAVCDVYDALVSDRVYRAAWSHERAIALLRDERQFDQRCVDALERVVQRTAGAVRASRERTAWLPTLPLRPPAALPESSPANGAGSV
jgi:HD-GYP domain-containing protein (c-di-GMP phosphodiesterase class II)